MEVERARMNFAGSLANTVLLPCPCIGQISSYKIQHRSQKNTILQNNKDQQILALTRML